MAKKPISPPRRFGSAAEREQGFRGGLKQEVVDNRLVLKGERQLLPRQCEDNMAIRHGEKVPRQLCGPAVSVTGLTARTVSDRRTSDQRPSRPVAYVADGTLRVAIGKQHSQSPRLDDRSKAVGRIEKYTG